MFVFSTMESRENKICYYFNVNSANGFLCENAQSINCARLFSLFYHEVKIKRTRERENISTL